MKKKTNYPQKSALDLPFVFTECGFVVAVKRKLTGKLMILCELWWSCKVFIHWKILQVVWPKFSVATVEVWHTKMVCKSCCWMNDCLIGRDYKSSPKRERERELMKLNKFWIWHWFYCNVMSCGLTQCRHRFAFTPLAICVVLSFFFYHFFFSGFIYCFAICRFAHYHFFNCECMHLHTPTA